MYTSNNGDNGLGDFISKSGKGAKAYAGLPGLRG